MKNKKNRQKWDKIIVVVCFLWCMIPIMSVQAASATLTFSTEAEEIFVGDIVEIQVTITADAVIGDVEAFLSYDDTRFEFYSATTCITGDDGKLKIEDIGASPSQQDRVYRIYFKALEQGECKIALYERPIVYNYSDGKEMSITGFSKTFTVKPRLVASSDSSLASIHLVDNLGETVLLTPTFSSDITTYDATVEYVSDTLIIGAISTDTKAMVNVLGGKELVLGNNEVIITVIAEDGSETVYTIFVQRLEKTENIEKVETPELILESGITATEKEEVVWLTQHHTYMVSEKPKDFVIPDGYVATILMIDGVQFTAYVKEEATQEEYLLLTLQNEAGEINWYRYDRIEQTLQRVCEEEYIVTQIVQQNEEELQDALLQYEIQQKGLIIVVAMLSGITLVLLMIILWLCIRNRNRG